MLNEKSRVKNICTILLQLCKFLHCKYLRGGRKYTNVLIVWFLGCEIMDLFLFLFFYDVKQTSLLKFEK